MRLVRAAAFGGAFEMEIDATFMGSFSTEQRNDKMPGRERFKPQELQGYIGALGDRTYSSIRRQILSYTEIGTKALRTFGRKRNYGILLEKYKKWSKSTAT
jgi:hypothetical protein